MQWASAGPWVVGHWKLVPSFIPPRPRRSLVTQGWTRDTCYMGLHHTWHRPRAHRCCGKYQFLHMRHKLMWMLVPNECFASPSKMRWCDMNMRNQGMRPATKLQATLWCQSPVWHVDSRGYLMENIWYSSQTHKKSRVAYKIELSVMLKLFATSTYCQLWLEKIFLNLI